MRTIADRSLQIVEHEGESYVLRPRSVPRSYDIVRLKDQLEVGAVWLAQGPPQDKKNRKNQKRDAGFLHAAAGGVSSSDIRKIVVAGIKGGLFA